MVVTIRFVKYSCTTDSTLHRKQAQLVWSVINQKGRYGKASSGSKYVLISTRMIPSLVPTFTSICIGSKVEGSIVNVQSRRT